MLIKYDGKIYNSEKPKEMSLFYKEAFKIVHCKPSYARLAWHRQQKNSSIEEQMSYFIKESFRRNAERIVEMEMKYSEKPKEISLMEWESSFYKKHFNMSRHQFHKFCDVSNPYAKSFSKHMGKGKSFNIVKR